MPRAFGSKKQGPDLSWDDDDLADPNDRRALSPPSNVPAPTYPPRTHKNIIRTPKPLTSTEKAAVNAQLRFRSRCREGPLFTVVDRSVVEGDAGEKKKDVRRRGFDPFEGQERYSTRFVKRRRTEPELGVSGRGVYGYSLGLFPEELWAVLDPGRTNPKWDEVGEDSVAVAGLRGVQGKKKKRKGGVDLDRLEREIGRGSDGEEEDDDDEDVVERGRRKKRRKEEKATGERSGLDAEDEIDAEKEVDENEDEGGEEEPEDSEFTEDEDEANDYQAEQYFEGGEDDDIDDGDGGGDY